MKTNEYKALLSKFYEGKTNRKEEDWLKKNTQEIEENEWFATLENEKKQTMDWDFNDFLLKAEETPIINLEVKKKDKFNYKPMLGLAACLILIFGLVFNLNRDSKEFNIKETIVQTPNTNQFFETPEKSVEILTKENHNVEPSREVMATKNKNLAKQKRKRATAAKEIKEIIIEDSQYHIGDVMIDGKPVQSQEEAQEILFASLIMLSDNIRPNLRNLQNLHSINSSLEKLSEL